jgi:glycosyltransferase involved in cell wall biosynthesis
VIGVLCTSYPRSPDDPAGSFVRTRVRALAAAGEAIEVIAAGAGSDTNEGNVRVFRIPAAGAAEIFYAGGAPEALESGGPEQRARAWLEAAHFTAGMMALATQRAAGWSAMESHWLVPSALVACAVAPHLPHCAHAHGGDVFLLARVPGGASLARLLCRSGSELVFASADLRHRFARLCGHTAESFGAHTCVQPAPFDSSLFRPRPVAERRGLRSGLGIHGFTVLAAGRLVPIKGYDVLVHAIGHLPLRERPTLVIAGAGPEEPRLRSLAALCAVDLRLPGLVSAAGLAEWMVAADLFVHPCRSLPSGRSEGAPVVVREALAIGLPVIASAQGGLPELAGHERLTLVEPEDPSALAAEIARLQVQGLRLS